VSQAIETDPWRKQQTQLALGRGPLGRVSAAGGDAPRQVSELGHRSQLNIALPWNGAATR
jgi:hypothetical protein